MTPRRHQSAISLSGGERRRLEIARAMATDPRYLLLDEPFTGVDPLHVAEIQGIIANLKKRRIGILITDHNASALLDVVDRVYIISEGHILVHGTPAEIRGPSPGPEALPGRSLPPRRPVRQRESRGPGRRGREPGGVRGREVVTR